MDRQLSNILNALDNSALVSVTDADGVIKFANPKFCEISGYSLDELMGRNHRIFKCGLHSPEFYDEMWETIAKGEVWEGDIWNKAKDGRFYCVKTTITPIKDRDGNIEEYISIRSDITLQMNQEKLLNEALRNLGYQKPNKANELVNRLEEIREKL